MAKAKTKKPTKTKATKKKPPVAKTKTVAKKRGAEAPRLRVSAPPKELLGHVFCPSGTLAILDPGLFEFLPRDALEPAIIKTPVPADRPLPVYGTRVGQGRHADSWDAITIPLVDNPRPDHEKDLDTLGCDFARIIVMDHGAVSHWKHEDALDGLGDFVFWGRDAPMVAKRVGAPMIADGHGWIDLPFAEAEARSDQVARLKAEGRLQLKGDLRPHTHHYQIAAAARANPRIGAGMLDLAGTTALLYFTTWGGHGVFPCFLDVDARNRPVQIRIQMNLYGPLGMG